MSASNIYPSKSRSYPPRNAPSYFDDSMKHLHWRGLGLRAQSIWTCRINCCISHPAGRDPRLDFDLTVAQEQGWVGGDWGQGNNITMLLACLKLSDNIRQGTLTSEVVCQNRIRERRLGEGCPNRYIGATAPAKLSSLFGNTAILPTTVSYREALMCLTPYLSTPDGSSAEVVTRRGTHCTSTKS